MSPAVTKSVIIGTVVVLSLYNIAAIYYGGRESSISYVLSQWALANPIVSVFAGILIGHWFWQV
jgi:hypothetical protein